jgi:ankyrin repeat protein
MPPKKSKSPGKGKKKKSLSRKRGNSKTKVIAQLDEKDCALPQISNNRNQAITSAVIQSDLRSLTRLVTHYHYDDVLNATDFNGSTPLHLACRKGDVIMTEKLLSYSKIDVNILEKPSSGGYSALHHACALGRVRLMVISIITFDYSSID